MTKAPTIKSKYQSPSTLEFVTSAQYLTEILMTRKYSIKNKILPHKFWSIMPYKKEFIMTIQRVQSLMKVYNEDAVVRAFFTNEGKRIYSVGYPGLDRLIAAEEKKINELNNIVPTIEHKDVSKETPKKSIGNKTLRTKLRELE